MVIRWIRLAAGALIALLVGTAPTTVLAAASFTYDSAPVSRVDVHRIEAARSASIQVSVAREDSASPSVEARGTSTTPHPRSVATNTVETTRVGRWMGQSEFDAMSSTGRVVEGGGGRTYVVVPPNPGAYKATGPGSVYAEFDVPSSSLRPASDPAYRVIPGPNVTTGLYGPPPAEMPSATCIVWVCSK